jgi:hypothetical protein
MRFDMIHSPSEFLRHMIGATAYDLMLKHYED